MSEPAPLGVAVDVSAVPAHLAGAGEYATALLGALSRRPEVALELVCRRSDDDRWHDVAPGSAVLAAAPDVTAARVVYGELALSRLVRRRFPQAAVFFGPHYTMPPGLRVPAVVTVHDLTFVDHPEWHERRKVAYFRHAIRRAARHAAVLVCVSERSATRLRAVEATRGAVVVVPHGVDHDRFRPEEPSAGHDAGVLDRLGVVEPYLLHLGTAEPRKNLPRLLRAFAGLGADGLGLVLAGASGWGGSDAAPSPPGVRRLGYVERPYVPALLRRAAVVAYPSYEEGFGLPALEALACGAPLVTSRDTAMADLAAGAAVLVDPFDDDSLRDGLEEALAAGQAGAERRRRGIEVAASYTWEQAAAAHVAAFRSASERAAQ